MSYQDDMNPYQAIPSSVPPSPVAADAATGIRPTVIHFDQVVTRGWQIFQENPWMAVSCFLVMFSVMMLFQLANLGLQWLAYLYPNDPKVMILIGVGFMVSSLVGSLAQWFLMIGQIAAFLKIARGQPASVWDLLSGGPMFLEFIALMILMTILTTIGMCPFLIGWIFVWLYLGVSLPLLIDKRVSIPESLRLSVQVTEGNRLTLFLLGLAGMAALIVSFLAFILPYLVVAPLCITIFTVAYLDMTGQPTALEKPQPV